MTETLLIPIVSLSPLIVNRWRGLGLWICGLEIVEEEWEI